MGQHRMQHPVLRALGAVTCAGAVAVMLAAMAPAPAAQAARMPHQVLDIGDRGRLVERLQHLLRLPADGMFGRRTRHAVRTFQRRHHLLADGQVGPHTWRALLRGPGAAHHRANDGILRLGDRGAGVAHVPLHLSASELPGSDTAEELFVTPLEHASEVQRLLGGETACMLLPDAHKILASVAE